MSRRFAPALLSALALALVPATASAQTPPPDERAAARAFADITLQTAKEIEAAANAMGTDVPTCKSERRLARGTKRQQLRMLEFIVIHEIAKFTRVLEPTLTRTVTALDSVPTADPILQDGRAAWHSVRRFYARIAELPHVRLCPVQRDYVRGDFKPTRAMRRAARVFRFAMRWDTSEIDRATRRAIERLIELGVPADEADGFDGELEHSDKADGSVEDEGTRDSPAGTARVAARPPARALNRDSPAGTARVAAQAPAPSNPLTSLRAAR